MAQRREHIRFSTKKQIGDGNDVVVVRGFYVPQRIN